MSRKIRQLKADLRKARAYQRFSFLLAMMAMMLIFTRNEMCRDFYVSLQKPNGEESNEQ